MEIVNLKRGKGKTTYLVYRSAITGYPIICYTQRHKEEVLRLAKTHSLDIPEPIVYSSDAFRSKTKTKYLVDEAPVLLQLVLGVDIDTMTLTDTNTLNEQIRSFNYQNEALSYTE